MENTFRLRIASPDGIVFDGEARSLLVRTTDGDVTILKNHCKYTAALAEGNAKVTLADGEVKTAFCRGGLVSVKDAEARLLAEAFDWVK